MTPTDKARARIKEWRTDPVKFAVDVFGIQPDPWQVDAMRALGMQQQLDDAMQADLAIPVRARPYH